jgi:hypothetical protein
MRVVGVRAEMDRIRWAVVQGTVEHLVLVAEEEFSAPNSYREAHQ